MGEMYDIAESNAVAELVMSENRKTYDEWKELGYHVCRGEKACGRNKKGQHVFSELQVEEDEKTPIDVQSELLGINEADLY